MSCGTAPSCQHWQMTLCSGSSKVVLQCLVKSGAIPSLPGDLPEANLSMALLSSSTDGSESNSSMVGRLSMTSIVQAFYNLTSHKLQQKQFHLFHTPDSILYDIYKVLGKFPGEVLKSGITPRPLISPLLNVKGEVCSYVARYPVR